MYEGMLSPTAAHGKVHSMLSLKNQQQTSAQRLCSLELVPCCNFVDKSWSVGLPFLGSIIGCIMSANCSCGTANAP